MAPSAKAKKAAKGKAGSATTTTTTTTIAAALSKADDAANKAVVSAADDKPKNEGDSAARPAPKTKDLAGSSPVTAELVLKASRALLKFLETQSASAAPKKPNLLDDEADEAGSHGIHNSEQVWLVVSTKKNLVDKKDLKPKPVKIPHPLLSAANTSALLLVKDPQRTFKDILLPSSPTVRKVLGLAKLRAKFKTYESLRQLRDTHDLVLGDERIIPSLRTALGSSFLKSTTKIPIPVRIAKKDGKPASQQSIEKEIKKAVEATYIHLSQTNSTNIRVGLVKHSAEQLMENAMAVIDCMITEKKIVKTGWKGIRGVYIKSGNSAALPLYLAPKLYDEEKDVITPEQRKEEKQASEEKKKEREERRKAKKARNTAAQKGISVATGATETKGANGVTAIEPAQKKRKADAELEKKEEVPKEELEGSPKAKKPKVLAVAKGKKASVEEKPTAPAEEAASTTKAKPSAQKGKKGKADAAEAPTPAAEEKKKEGEAGSTAGRAKAAKASKKASKPTTTSETDAPAAENPVEERKEESSQAEKPVAKAAGKKGKAAKGDSAAQEKVEGKKEEVKRRSKRVNTGGKA